MNEYVKVQEMPSPEPREGQLFKAKDTNQYGIIERDGKSLFAVVGSFMYTNLSMGEAIDLLLIDNNHNVLASTKPEGSVKKIAQSLVTNYIKCRINGARINKLKQPYWGF